MFYSTGLRNDKTIAVPDDICINGSFVSYLYLDDSIKDILEPMIAKG